MLSADVVIILLQSYILLRLLKVYKDIYKLEPVDETDLTIKSIRNFDPERSEVTMSCRPAKFETAEWQPADDEDSRWKVDKKIFTQVST